MPTIRLSLFIVLALSSRLDFSHAPIAQTPPVIQIFMPGGTLPTREVRFWLTRNRQNAELLFTDKKGQYQFAPELVDTGEVTLTVDTDKHNFETTTYRIRLARTTTYIPVFLLPLRDVPIPARSPGVAEADAQAPATARAAYEAAQKEAAAGRAEPALSEFTRALTLYPRYLRVLDDLGLLYLKLNRLDEAAAAFTQAISISTRFHLPRLHLGLVRNRQGRYGEAVMVLNELVKDQPTLGQARVLLADGLLVSKQFDEAEQQLRAGLQDETLERSTRADAYVKLGRALSGQERYQAALSELEKAVALEPESAEVQFYLGAAYLQLDRLAAAEAALLKAYALGGKRMPLAQLLLGQLYYSQQKYEAALQAFEQYLTEAPRAANVPQVKEVIEKIKLALKK
ncbi:MAG: tetratricopeptide repeat protein [Acidobacteria bacterium]|nr:tetratricopeptide repeat protein [Acidobacteriota bacterium]MBI3426689.1 tetratricopeptide repeat protein [Acidobacteriota bacterium]